MKKLAIIGGGNLGTAIARGVLEAGDLRPEEIVVTKRNPGTLTELSGRGVEVLNNNREAVAKAGMVILAVKPYQAREVLGDVEFRPGQTLVSVVTGFGLADLRASTRADIELFRAMPNTAIAVRQSMTCISHDRAEADARKRVEGVFSTLGRVLFIDEKLMNAATVLGACGIAYAMRYMRANIQGGIQIGFDAATASLIAEQTVKGAVELLMQDSGTHPEVEIDKVTTPRGCTIAGLNEMEHQGFSSSLIKGVVTSFEEISRF
jgi:pyrroline-5-carboxylate reductase